MKTSFIIRTAGVSVLAVAAIIAVTWYVPFSYTIYDASANNPHESSVSASTTPPIPVFVVTHIPTPPSVKGIYMSSWVAGDGKLRGKLVDLIDTTELNAVVVDIKDYTGRVSFHIDNPIIKDTGVSENRIPDIKTFIGSLHDKGIYVIGRISTFQDPYYVKIHPELAVHTKAGAVWADHKGIKWIDPGAESMWQYLATLAEESYKIGFDEIQFDYIRFPSDGNMKDIAYPYSDGRTKASVLNDFFAFVDSYLRPKNIPISADFFGLVTNNKDDLGIGQVLEDGLAHFDFVSPMVYPSHYPYGFNGWKDPNTKPYETIAFALKEGANRAIAASSSPLQIRPWLQDFSMRGVTYTPAMVRAQIQATNDVGLNSWLLWNASNVYSREALLDATSSAE